MGKAYANRKKQQERPKNDFYQTPIPLTEELLKLNLFNSDKVVLDPACGDFAITNILNNYFKKVYAYDIKYNFDFLKLKPNEIETIDYIITNPPFSLFDAFVIKAKEIAKDKIAFIGKTNFFGAEKRNRIGIWKNLKYVFIFSRQVDYRFFREDDKILAGNLVTGWFIWDMGWNKDFWMTSIIDVQKYMLRREV